MRYALKQSGIVLAALVLMAIHGPMVFAATTATVTTQPTFDLYQGSSLVSPRVTRSTFAECVEAGRLLNKGDGCQSRNGKFKRVTVAGPVDCVVSAPVETAGAWSACSAGTRTRTITSTMTVVTPAANGGLACPSLVTTRSESESCAVVPSASIGGGPITAATAVTLAAGSSDWRRYPGVANTGTQLSSITGNGTVRTAIESWGRMVDGAGDHLHTSGAGSYLQFTAPADETERALLVYVGGYNSSGRLTATLAGATTYTHLQPQTSGDYFLAYRLTYKTAIAGTITIRWELAAGAGNVIIQGASIEGVSVPVPPVPVVGTAALTWTAPTQNRDGSPIAQPVRYEVYHGTNPNVLSEVIPVTSLAYTFNALPSGTHYFAVAAITVDGKSELSAIGSKVIP